MSEEDAFLEKTMDEWADKHMSEGYFINEGEKMYFPEGVKPVTVFTKVRERIMQDIGLYGPDNDTSTILQHKVIDSYLLLQVLDKLESMSLALDAMLDYNTAQWHERKTK